MKTLLLSFALALCAGRLAAQTETNSVDHARQREEFRREIQRVFRERAEALAHATTVHHTKLKDQYRVNQALFFKACQAIKTDGCPKTFKLGWFDYMTAWQQQRKHVGFFVFEAVGTVATGGGLALVLGHEALGSFNKAMRDDPNLAWRGVERVALQYDVDPDKT